MKRITVILFALLATLSLRADIIFQDAFNYSDGLIENDGLWQVYSPAVPLGDAFVTNHLLILNQNNSDAVAAQFTNDTGSSIIYASFTINVSTLPSTTGGYFASFQDTNFDYVGKVFIGRTGTVVPGTYRIGIDNFASSASSAKYFPLDLATGITYVVVFSYDTNLSDPYPNATLAVNPASESDFDNSPTFGTDTGGTAGQTADPISRIAFSQYANQGVAGIGHVFVGTSFGDVFTNTPQIPVIGLPPQSTNLYAGYNLQLYTAASGLGTLSYQWLSNNIPLVDDGVSVVGSVSNGLTLFNLQTSANYSVVVANSAGSVTSAVTVVTINTTPTAPFFTSQPYSSTNSLGSAITLSGVANGTGPISYTWYYEPTNAGATFGAIATGATLYISPATFANTGYYYVQAANSVSTANSATVFVQVIPPPTVTIGYLHSLLISNAPTGSRNINGTAIYSVTGVVTSFGTVESKTYSEYFIQDGTGGALVFVNGAGNTNTPPAGSVVQVTGSVQQYYGGLELVPNVTNNNSTVSILSNNVPLPAPALLNLPLMATNPMGPYGLGIQCSLVTVTNVYLYSSAAGAAVSGNFAANTTKALYAFQQPYFAGEPYMEIFVFTYTNVMNSFNMSYVGQPIPSFAYELTGEMGIFSTTTPEIYPTRFVDIVSTLPAAFAAGISATNGAAMLSWPAVTGSTYSVYSASSLLGPWTQTFGLSYYPSTGTYTATNAGGARFYKVSTP